MQVYYVDLTSAKTANKRFHAKRVKYSIFYDIFSVVQKFGTLYA